MNVPKRKWRRVLREEASAGSLIEKLRCCRCHHFCTDHGLMAKNNLRCVLDCVLVRTLHLVCILCVAFFFSNFLSVGERFETLYFSCRDTVEAVCDSFLLDGSVTFEKFLVLVDDYHHIFLWPQSECDFQFLPQTHETLWMTRPVWS